MKSVCVFCGSSPGNHPRYLEVARDLGRLLAERRCTLVYGGGRVGLMGAVADAVLQAGGRAVGVIPQLLLDKEVGHTGLSELHVVQTMAQRKQLMGDLSDAFLTLPGGIGTMDELFEAWTWTQLDLHRKPCGLLNQDGYYDSLVAFIDHCQSEGFLRPRHAAALIVETDLSRLFDRLGAAAGQAENQ
ncbi:TIGR00730 family Rossman fold protein [Povalibacter sp.]|uniref:LOG family protein n=1 Tax=Povalibacter sp. TaxID=1962978 RepID=UPI002F429C38